MNCTPSVMNLCYDRQPPHSLENFDKQIHSPTCTAPSNCGQTVDDSLQNRDSPSVCVGDHITPHNHWLSSNLVVVFRLEHPDLGIPKRFHLYSIKRFCSYENDGLRHKYFLYPHKNSTRMLIVTPTNSQANFHLSSTMIGRVSLFCYVHLFFS